NLAFNGADQVGDVVPLEELLAQRVERGAPVGRRCVLLAVPAAAQLLDLSLMLVVLAVDRPARGLEPGAKVSGVGARFAQLANLVELLVEREYLFEQGRRDLGRS